MSALGNLYSVAKRNNLRVELKVNPEGLGAIWVFPSVSRIFTLHDVRLVMDVGIVASPFWVGQKLGDTEITYESSAPQLIQMLAERGYE